MQTLIRGDTWQIDCVYGGDTPESIAGVTIKSKMRLGPEVVEFTVVDREADDGTGHFRLTAAPADTDVTPGIWRHDVEFTTGGIVRSTVATEIRVTADVTYGA